jgi:NhaP-type Na+/H+ or K+/H+ antiporter
MSWFELQTIDLSTHWQLAITNVTSTLCARLVAVMVTANLCNLKREYPISLKRQCVMWSCGLRSVIPVVLVSSIPVYDDMLENVRGISF